MTHRYVLNGKFLSVPMTGVHRVAAELANALADLVAEGDPAIAGKSFEMWVPSDGAERAREIRLACKVVKPLTHIPWEQLTLPLKQGNATLLNLCNIGPMLSGDAVTMIHDVQVHLSPESYSRPFRLWYHFNQPIFARRHRRILTVSEYSKAEIVRVGLAPPDKIGVVHNGVDHILRDLADPAAFDRLGLIRHRYVVALSTTQVHKNIRILLEAFADPALSDLSLVLVGSTGREAFEAAGHAVPPNVRFAGRVSDGELRGLMEQALCFAFPSTTEGFGLPPLEAMLVGCPAVVAPCGAIPEVCGDAASYAKADEVGAWVAAICALRAAERAARTAVGHAHARRFTWRAAALRLAAELDR